MKKKNCKSFSLIQTLIYRSNIYCYKIYHKGTWKNNSSPPCLVMWQGKIQKKSVSGSRTLSCLKILFQSSIFIWKWQKRSLNRSTLVPALAIYQTKCSFLVFPMLPYDLDYSLCGLGISDIDTQLNFLEIKWIYILLNPTNPLWKGSHQWSQGPLKTCFLIPALLVEVQDFVNSLNSLHSCGYKKVLRKLEFWIYGLVNHLDPNGTKHASRSQTPRSRYFLMFFNWIKIIILDKMWYFQENQG